MRLEAGGNWKKFRMSQSKLHQVLIGAIILSCTTFSTAFSEDGQSRNAEPAFRIDTGETAAAMLKRRNRGRRERGEEACKIIEACKNSNQYSLYKEVCTNTDLKTLYNRRCDEFRRYGL